MIISKLKTVDSNFCRYLFGWCLTALLANIDWGWLSIAGYAVPNGLVLNIAQSAIGILLLSAFLTGISRIDRYSPLAEKIRLNEIADVTRWVVLLACFFIACNTLQYLCTTMSAPLVDEELVKFDRALGFEWLDLYHWVHSYKILQRILAIAYLSFSVQLLAVPIILGLTRSRAGLSEFVMLIMVAEVLLLFVSTTMPASSAFVYFGITDLNTAETVSDFHLLRSGALKIINPVQGLVSFPSFHTMVAIICTYALRRLPVIFPAAALLNIVMIASTPTQGGHYLADVVGGFFCGGAIIWGFRRLSDHATPQCCVRQKPAHHCHLEEGSEVRYSTSAHSQIKEPQ